MYFDIHLSVPHNTPLDVYKEICKKAGFKPLVISYTEDGKTVHDMIASKVVSSTPEDSEREVGLHTAVFEIVANVYNVDIARYKIECEMGSIWEQKGLPFVDDEQNNNAFKPGDYCEIHFKVSPDFINYLRDIGFNVSRNVDNGNHYATYRSFDVQNFSKNVERIKAYFNEMGIAFSGQEMEYCLIDSNMKFDPIAADSISFLGDK